MSSESSLVALFSRPWSAATIMHLFFCSRHPHYHHWHRRRHHTITVNYYQMIQWNDYKLYCYRYHYHCRHRHHNHKYFVTIILNKTSVPCSFINCTWNTKQQMNANYWTMFKGQKNNIMDKRKKNIVMQMFIAIFCLVSLVRLGIGCF